MKDNNNLLYIVLIIVLAIIIGVLWFLIITNDTSINGSINRPPSDKLTSVV